jgi:LAO/AO transport system kinase
MQMKQRLSIHDYTKGILDGNRVVLGQAITLIESNLPADERLASEVIEKILHRTGNSIRIGLTGVPGVGKSTFIEAFGKHVINQNKKLAVLTIDPSSPITKGSILGDKTRMEELSKNPSAFIRPTASGNALGGVASKTREAMLLCEAAGYDVIIIETVGVGQSEVAVKNMVDFFLLLVLAGAGDELQGIKKGIMEMADGIVITKADGDNVKHATEAQAEYQHALHLSSATHNSWQPKVLTASAMLGEGIDDVWKMILKFDKAMKGDGSHDENRRNQNVNWFRDYFKSLLENDLEQFSELASLRKQLEELAQTSKVSSHQAARRLLNAYHEAIRGSKS